MLRMRWKQSKEQVKDIYVGMGLNRKQAHKNVRRTSHKYTAKTFMQRWSFTFYSWHFGKCISFILWIYTESMASNLVTWLLPYPPSWKDKAFKTIFQLLFQNLHLFSNYLFLFLTGHLKSSHSKWSLKIKIHKIIYLLEYIPIYLCKWL